MANKRLDYDKIYALITEYRKAVSVIGNGVWNLKFFPIHSIAGYDDYVKKLALIYRSICAYGTDNAIMPIPKQDVVCVNMADSEPDVVEESYTTPVQTHLTDAIILQYGGVNIILPEKLSDNSLSRVTRILKEEVC